MSERKALAELRGKHRYLMFELTNKDERSTSLFKIVGKRMTYTNAVAIKLVVPEKSALGKEILAMRKAKTRKRKP